jgi:hypothetical protein
VTVGGKHKHLLVRNLRLSRIIYEFLPNIFQFAAIQTAKPALLAASSTRLIRTSSLSLVLSQTTFTLPVKVKQFI